MGIEIQIALEAGLEYAIAVFDISKAFLHADYPEEAGKRRPIVRAPAEYVFKKIHSGRRGLRIRKALYGLRRSPNLFQGHFRRAMENIDFKSCPADINFYVQQPLKAIMDSSNAKTITNKMTAHVDDGILSGLKHLVLATFGQLRQIFSIEKVPKIFVRPGDFAELLGARITRTAKGLTRSTDRNTARRSRTTSSSQTVTVPSQFLAESSLARRWSCSRFFSVLLKAQTTSL